MLHTVRNQYLVQLDVQPSGALAQVEEVGACEHDPVVRLEHRKRGGVAEQEVTQRKDDCT